MEKQELKNRSEVPVELTWDLDVLFASREEYETALKKLQADVTAFATKFSGNLKDAKTIIASIQAYEEIMIQISMLYHYASLPATTDLTNAQNTQMSRQFDNAMANVSAALSFYDSELTDRKSVV